MPIAVIWFCSSAVPHLPRVRNRSSGAESPVQIQVMVDAERRATRACDSVLPHPPSPATMRRPPFSPYSSCCPAHLRLPYSCLPPPDRGEAWYPAQRRPLPASFSPFGRRDCQPKGGEEPQSRIWKASSLTCLELTASRIVGQRPCHTRGPSMQLTSH